MVTFWGLQASGRRVWNGIPWLKRWCTTVRMVWAWGLSMMYRHTYGVVAAEWTPRNHWHAYDWGEEKTKRFSQECWTCSNEKKTSKMIKISAYIISTSIGDYGMKEVHHSTFLRFWNMQCFQVPNKSSEPQYCIPADCQMGIICTWIMCVAID